MVVGAHFWLAFNRQTTSAPTICILHTFHTLAALNQAIKVLMHDLNQRPMKGYNGLCRAELFAQIDAPALSELPQFPYEYTQFKLAKVAKDYHVAFDDHWYSVPHALVDERVELLVSQRLVRIRFKGNVIAQHVRSQKRYQHTTESAHMPEAHAAYKDATVERNRCWAKRIGPNAVQVVHAIEQSKPHVEQAQRSCQGILSLQKRYGEQRLERACGIALSQACYTVKFIRTVLQNGRDNVFDFEPNRPIPTHHDNVRGADYYS
jgi:hypothetical protein